MSSWNIVDAWEIVSSAVPDRIAQQCGDRAFTYAEFDRRANALAADLLDAGLGRQAKVAAYLYNGPEYMEVYSAAFKAGLVPVNTNYRYGVAELRYLFDNADAEAVVFSASFASLIDQIRGDLPKVKRWYTVDDGNPTPAWAVPYGPLVAAGAPRVSPPWGRSGDDLLLLYTGGTTGMPKGVMWRQHDLWMALGGGGSPILGLPPAEDHADYRGRIEAGATSPATKLLPACPLMHGTGQFMAMTTFNAGGCLVTMPDRSFDASRLWQTVQDDKVNTVVIVGDAFARPMLAELDAAPGRWDLSSLILIVSSGVMWSQEVKAGLTKHLPSTILYDGLGSSEALMGSSTSAASGVAATASFKLAPGTAVITDDDRIVAQGSAEIGKVAVPGYIPIGYYKDPEKTARTFRTVDGTRYSIPGDYATVEADGGIRLLGRGSVVINTGGEKVFPEEVEEVLKRHPAVRDAVCIGLPDERFGQTICAIVEPAAGSIASPDELVAFVRGRLAPYKAPRTVLTVDTIGRTPAGKVDYPGLTRLAKERAGLA
jgi:fatty-acyl-CoA synthase